MRMTLVVTFALLVVAVPAIAELQNVEVGGSIRLRYNYYSPEGADLSFTDKGNSLSFVEQRTRLNIKADFTNDVSAFIELDSYDIYGEDFRAAPFITALDTRASSTDDVEVYQAYIDINDAWGYPLSFRFGRQEFSLGSEWLVGVNDTAAIFSGLSFDGIKAVYTHDNFTLTGRFAKLAETSPTEEDGDTDLWSVYFSYTAIEDITIDAYWIFVDSGLSPTKVTPGLSGGLGNLGLDIVTGIENFFGVDRFDDTTTLHTFGLRGSGAKGNFDFEAEIAYQDGDAALATSGGLNPGPASGLPFVFGEDNAEFDAWGANLEVGYTFDVEMQPRIYLGLAFFEGDDQRENDFGDFLMSLLPFTSKEASIGFNRLFSNWEYSEFLANTDLSNSLIYRGGISFQPSEKVDVSVIGTYFEADDETTTNTFLGLPGFNVESDDELGFEVGLYLTYHYSEDLAFDFGYAHFFTGDGIEDGNFVSANGLGRLGGTPVLFRPFGLPKEADDDADYVYFETTLSF